MPISNVSIPLPTEFPFSTGTAAPGPEYLISITYNSNQSRYGAYISAVYRAGQLPPTRRDCASGHIATAMKLVTPTDFDILVILADGRRNNAVNVAYRLELDRAYINTRLPALEDYGLVASAGPAPTSGLYEITARGRAAAAHRERYDDAADFEGLVDDALADRRADAQ